MNSTTEYTNPRNRDFSDELKALELKLLMERRKDVDIMIEYGLFPDWASYPVTESPGFKYWDLEDILRYRKNLYMELLDRCKSFELFPKIKFNF